MTILVLANNEKEDAIAAIESIRNYETDLELNVILVDNASTDGLGEWAQGQEDISYAYMENGLEPWGSVLNQVIEGFELTGDVLIMQSRFILLPGCLERMLDGFGCGENVAVVGPVTVWAEEYQQQTSEKVQTIEEAISYMTIHSNDRPEIVLGIESGVFLIRTELLKQAEIRFNDNIVSLYVLVKDLAIQLIFKNLKTVVRRDSLLYEKQVKFSENVRTLQYIEKDNSILEGIWGTHYFNMTANPHILNEINSDGKKDVRVIEIGCDCGATLLGIKNKIPDAKIYGCDISELAVKIASRITDGAFVSNIEEENIPVEPHSFDYVIFGDVLEHLHNPKRTLEYVKRILKPDGKVVASIPNLMNISVMKQLLKGDFTYTETGLLDKTHIHLFTFNEIIKIFTETGYSIEGVLPLKGDISDRERKLIDGLLALEPSAERHMYETFQYIVIARL